MEQRLRLMLPERTGHQGPQLDLVGSEDGGNVTDVNPHVERGAAARESTPPATTSAGDAPH